MRSRAEGGVRAGPPRKGEGGLGRCWVDLGRVLAGLWAFWVLGFQGGLGWARLGFWVPFFFLLFFSNHTQLI